MLRSVAAPADARGLRRTLPFTLTRSAATEPDDGLDFEGYAAVFGSETLIDSWEGRFLESIAPGAFRRSIREKTPVLQFDHGRHPLVGSIPIGVITELAEDDRGLAVTARLHETWLTEPVRTAIASGAINGMSFRFTVVREEWRDAQGKVIKDDRELLTLLYEPSERGSLRRTLVEVKVPELGPVVFPAYSNTSASLRNGPSPARGTDGGGGLRTQLARSGQGGRFR
ncbi:HK97 family phage prohead protease [Geodermatophilus sp. URMC 62]|uniref:HK97 family phage prohead protease n=1 Tax=Geodermatophilus sp. URMC 62 TaxID=3423414 RepID=UPI00406C8830